MPKLYGIEDVDPHALAGRRVAVLGYGSQGRAQALNLRDSGLDVTVGLRRGGGSWRRAEGDGWLPRDLREAVSSADLVAVLIPDMAQPAVFRQVIEPNLRQGAALLFSHGFNVHYGQVVPPADADVVMIAPKAPGNLLRRQYELGRGVPCLLAIHQDVSGGARAAALAYADGLGGTRAGVIETTFAEETETDLFGEQAVLCGGVTELITAGWETLVDAGYQPEVAYFECMNELKLIVDLLYEGGFSEMHRYVSETAKYGDLSRGSRVVDGHVRETMKKLLEEVQSGEFAREWIREDQAGRPRYRELLRRDLEHPLEKVAQRMRARMTWRQTPVEVP